LPAKRGAFVVAVHQHLEQKGVRRVSVTDGRSVLSRRSLMSAVTLIGLTALAYGPTVYGQQNVRGFDEEIQRSNAERRIELNGPGPAAAEPDRERDFQARAREAYRRYGFTPDVFQEAVWAYRSAVIERLGQGEITRAQASALIAEYAARIVAERQKLQFLQQQAESADRAAQAAFWSQFSQSMYQMGQAMQQYERQQQLRTPISCTTQYFGTIARTTCY